MDGLQVKSRGLWVTTCDPLIMTPLTYDKVNQISRTVSITFDIRATKPVIS